MELTWTVRGAFANWTLTVNIDPPEPENNVEFRDDWRKEPFTRLYLHFGDVVNLLEVGRQLEAVRGYRLSYS